LIVASAILSPHSFTDVPRSRVQLAVSTIAPKVRFVIIVYSIRRVGGFMATWAIVKKPELTAVSVHDPRTDTRTDSERFRDFAREAGIDENDPAWVRVINALESLEEWQAGMMTEYLEMAFMGFELEASMKAFNAAQRNK
jgi:hypothetical protein